MIRFRTTVDSAELLDGGRWLLTIEHQVEPKPTPCQLTANHLVVATGILSDPFMPDLKGSSTFQRPLFHTHAHGSHASALQNTNAAVVFGTSKSAWDACYLAATQNCGVVHWIIRASSNGPT
jgi:cation diffusion facilitator CzcD-associated flavoprotein CzcO